MKTKTNTRKTLCFIIGFVLLLCSIITGGGLFVNLQTTYASTPVGPNKISNANFTSYEGSTEPYSSSSYTAYSNKLDPTSTISLSDYNLASTNNAGIINLEDSKNVTKYNAKRESVDKYAMLISGAPMGFVTSGKYTLNADSYYVISADVLTISGSADLYLYEDDKVYAEKTDIQASGWTTYFFFVSTTDLSHEIKLGLFMPSNGTVLFDNLSLREASYTNFSTTKNALSASRYTFVDEKSDPTLNNVIAKYTADVVTPSNGLKFAEINSSDITLTESIESDGINTSSVKFSSNTKTHSTFVTSQFSNTAEKLTFDKNAVFKVTVTAKATNLDGSISLTLIDDSSNEKNSDDISITKNTDSNENVKNGFVDYSFFIKSNQFESRDYKLQVSFGSSESETSGEFYISQVVLSRVTSKAYTSGLDLTTKTIKDNKNYFDNGNFNSFDITDFNHTFPATPTSWTVTSGEHDQYYGVVNTETTEFNSMKTYLGIDVANPSSENLNVLMMYNASADKLTYLSKTKNYSADTYHAFEIKTRVYSAKATVSLVATINEKEVTLAKVSSDATSDWQTLKLYLHTGSQSLDVAMKLEVETESTGYAYFNSARIDYNMVPLTSESFSSTVETETLVKADLDNVINYLSGDGETLSAEIKTIDGRTAAQIKNSSATTYTYTSSLGYELTSGSYYHISVDVLTNILIDEAGAKIGLTSFDESFEKILSNTTWTTYHIYINPDKATTAYLTLTMSGEGTANFSNITFENIDNFDSKEANATTLIVEKVAEDDEDTEETKTEDNTTKTPGYVWLYYVASLLFAASIIIAIVGVLIRKIKWKKPVKKSKNDYDRNKTVSKQYYERKATTLREEKIREAEKELESLHAQRKEFEDNYKQDLKKLRDMKIKRANPNDIKNFEHDMKKNQKVTAAIGVNINKIEADLQYMRTDSYFNSLVRKLMNERNEK